MGLAQRELESAGIATVSLSPIPELTLAAGGARVAGIEHPFGSPLGRPGDREGQAAVLRATLEVLAGAKAPGIVELPFVWPEPRSKARAHPQVPPPIADLLKRKPWLALRLLSGDIPEQ